MADSLTLRLWLDRSGKSDVEFARLISISPSHLSSIASGRRTASLRIALQIEKATNGEVPPSMIAPAQHSSTDLEAAE